MIVELLFDYACMSGFVWLQVPPENPVCKFVCVCVCVCVCPTQYSIQSSHLPQEFDTLF